MREYKKTMRKTLINVTCDVCKRSCLTHKIVDAQDEERMFEFATLSANWGYFSESKDGEKHVCHLCEKCYDVVRAFIEGDLKGYVDVEQTS